MSDFFGGDDATDDSGLGGMADDIAGAFAGHDSWVDSGDDAAVMEKATADSNPRGVFRTRCHECGQLGGEHDSAEAAQQAGRDHVIEAHNPGWTVQAL